jgi:uncharacterized protein YggL (DUF469 family)
MNKRLKKKKHMGPFAQYCVTIAAKWKGTPTVEQINQTMDLFVEQIEILSLYCGGGSGPLGIELTLAHENDSFPKQAQLKQLVQWMETNGSFIDITVSPYEDAWYPDRKLTIIELERLNKAE